MGTKTKKVTKRSIGGKDPFNSVDLGYKALWKSPDYHLVNGKAGLERTSLFVERNDHNKYLQVEKIDRHPPQIGKFADRVPIASERYPPNEHRFLNIDKLPNCSTMKKHLRNISFTKYTKRNLKDTLFPFQGYPCDYDRYVDSKDRVMKNLNSVAINMSKSVGRVTYRSHVPIKSIINESLDPLKANMAKREIANGK